MISGAWQGEAGPGEACRGMACPVLAWQGLTSGLGAQPVLARRVRSGPGIAWPGLAWHRGAWQWLPCARRGMPGLGRDHRSPEARQVSARRGFAWHGPACPGVARQGPHRSLAAGHGRAGRGAARQALVWRRWAWLGRDNNGSPEAGLGLATHSVARRSGARRGSAGFGGRGMVPGEIPATALLSGVHETPRPPHKIAQGGAGRVGVGPVQARCGLAGQGKAGTNTEIARGVASQGKARLGEATARPGEARQGHR